MMDELRDRRWWTKWAKRQVVYSFIVYPVVLLLYIPFNGFIIGFSAAQWVHWFAASVPYAFLANLVIGPWSKFIWQKNWSWEHPSKETA